ncbi:hypothetical protein P5673_027408 [Acropora cervicornis]|uniref:Uncharacterized protein n=1 Tax=Acropora cervicornis TaxID=6130 RepID=A0AAD9PZA0_ACRCE|nr:hypothetical protein P5673_027408 [Acropora cervicornis]
MDSDSFCLSRAAHIVRREILKKNAVPVSLVTLVGIIIKGPTTRIDPSDSQACLSIAQLIVFNSISRPRDGPEATGSTHHIRSRECPLPIYTALKIHGATRDRSLIDTFYNLGMCISYDRFLSVSTEITNSVIERYEREGVVCTTSITTRVPPAPRAHFMAQQFLLYSILAMLQVAPMALAIGDLNAPEVPQQLLTSRVSLSDERGYDEEDWLSNTQELVAKEKLQPKDFVSWAAYRASQSSLCSYKPAIISLLPMFAENAHSLAMIAHTVCLRPRLEVHTG